MEKDKLIKPKNYAKINNITTATVYNWIREKKIDSLEIDGVKFVIKKDPRN